MNKRPKRQLPGKKEKFFLSEEQIRILDREQKLHATGSSKSYTVERALQIIKGKRDF